MASPQPSNPRIIVVGSGFAGISAYTTLTKKGSKNASITLVSDSLFFAHIPLIHEVAAGTIQPELVYWPVTEYIKCPKDGFIHGRVVLVNADAKTLAVKRADGNDETLSYDFLILAAGSETTTFDIRGADVHAFAFRTLHDAEHIRNRILDVCAEAEKTTDKKMRDELLSVIFIGAGASGIELVGEIGQMIAHELTCLHPTVAPNIHLTMIERGAVLLKERTSAFGKRVEETLQKIPNLHVLHECSVEEVSEEGVTTDKGFISGRTSIWTGGSRAVSVPIISTKVLPTDTHTGRIMVTSFLHTEMYPNVFVAGDQAYALQPDGTAYGMRAQFAVRQGRTAAENILRVLRGEEQIPFVWKEHGFILTIGKGHALAEIGGFLFSGRIAWIICHAVYIQAIVGFRLRLKSTWYWTKHFIKDRNVCKLSGTPKRVG